MKPHRHPHPLTRRQFQLGLIGLPCALALPTGMPGTARPMASGFSASRRRISLAATWPSTT